MRFGFRDSAVTAVTAFTAEEKAVVTPQSIFPAFVGSGALVLGVDATGLQAMPSPIAAAFGVPPDTSDLYVMRIGEVSDILSESNVQPFGHLSWALRVAETDVDPTAPGVGAQWSRTVDLRRARVTTRMTLADTDVWIRVWTPFGRDEAIVEVGATAVPGSQSANALLELSVCHHFDLRDGRDNLSLTADSAALRSQDGRLHAYRVSAAPDCDVERTPGAVTHRWRGIGGVRATLRFAFGPVAAATVPLAADHREVDRLRTKHEADWARFFDCAADVEGVDTLEQFEYHTSLALIRAGADPARGIPIGAPFSHPRPWRASTFWDSDIVCDGLLAAGQRDYVARFVGHLRTAMRPKGRPFPWMFGPDGVATVDPHRDHAPVAMAAHAMTAAKLLEYGAPTWARGWAYDIVRRVADHFTDHCFENDDGSYALSAVTHDVSDEAPAEVAHTYTTVWALTILAKALEYDAAGLISLTDPVRARAILGGAEIPQNATRYLHARSIDIVDFEMASWAPFLLYPTEGTRFVDPTLFAGTRALGSFNDFYLAKQGDFQPWTSLMQALSDMRAGFASPALEAYDRALDALHGPGYFSEIQPRQETVGLPPYITAHGAFVAALLYRLVAYDFWRPSIRLFGFLTPEERERNLCVARVDCPHGVRVHRADWRRGDIRARITTCQEVQLRLANGELARTVLIDGAPVDPVIDGEDVVCRLTPGDHDVEAKR